MPTIVLTVFKLFGWKKLFGYAWRLAKPQLEKAAKSTKTDFDDDALKILSEIIEKIMSDPFVK